MLAVAVAVAPACASKKFVRTEVGAVNSKVDTLSGTVEETQEALRKESERIGQVDQRAQAAGKAAQTAQAAADAANSRANAVGKEAAAATDKVNTNLTSFQTETRRLIYTVTLSEDQGNFKFGKTELPDEAKARLDQVVNQLKGDTSKNIFIEIEGHTDNVGSPVLNKTLGLERAETVKRYLYEQHQIPLHRMNVISYGETKPATENRNRDGRAQNRRVVIRILA
jgi:outer membrane protein OmpA-like peptidoglycan-associated protein